MGGIRPGGGFIRIELQGESESERNDGNTSEMKIEKAVDVILADIVLSA